MDATTVPSRNLPITQGRLADFPANAIQTLRQLYERHGELAVLEEERQRLVFIFGPKYNQLVLSDAKRFHSRFFAIRGPKKSAHRRITSGLLSMNGEPHRDHRRMVMGPFQKRAIVQYHDAIVDLTAEMLDRWTVGETRDMHHEMVQHMLRITSALLFGCDIPELAYDLGETIDRWVRMNHQTGIGAFISDPSYLENYDRLLQLAEEVEPKVRQLIELRRRSSKTSTDVLSLLLQAHGGQGISDDQLVGHVTLLFGAAHLTTAHTFCWTLFLLAQHPSIMRQLQAELDEVPFEVAPAPHDLSRMPLTERVIKESMRILPASGYSQRMNPEPVELGPLRLAAGSAIIFSQFMTHHMPSLYPDPESFRPDRWESITPGPYEYLPFGAGPRMCVGGPMAMMILRTSLPMILKRFTFQVVPHSTINGNIISTMLGPIGSVPMRLSAPGGPFVSQPVSGNIHKIVNLKELPLVRRAA